MFFYMVVPSCTCCDEFSDLKPAQMSLFSYFLLLFFFSHHCASRNLGMHVHLLAHGKASH